MPEASQPAPMKRPPVSTNSIHWHIIAVAPATNHAKIHFYNKLNPVWWFGNVDDPVPPPWYRTNSRHRTFLWHLRNPFHNFDHYVIGVADKKFVRSGRWPERNSNPAGGWDLEVARRKLAVLPFLSYERGRFNFYSRLARERQFWSQTEFLTPPKEIPASENAPTRPAKRRARNLRLFAACFGAASCA